MKTLDRILETSRQIDSACIKTLGGEFSTWKTVFSVPPKHHRFQKIKEYGYQVGQVNQVFGIPDSILIVDRALQSFSWFQKLCKNKQNIVWLSPREEETKSKSWLDNFLKSTELKGVKTVIAIGGGVIVNVTGYLAEKYELDLVYVPSTVLAMADGSVGGKVRLNTIDGDVFSKHTYKTFYEPNSILVDPRFLDSLPMAQIASGLGEIIKHGVFQSEELLNFLISDQFQIINHQSLLKVVLWTVALKKVCLDIDPDETKGGSYKILRGGHDLSDSIEEASEFKIPHGVAVSNAILTELKKSNSDLVFYVEKCFEKFSIPKVDLSILKI